MTTIFTCAVLVLSPLFCLHLLQSLRATESDVLEQQQQLTELQDLLGYGGLIHNFKNWVLRPDEVEYRDTAREQAAEAIAVLALLDRGLDDQTTGFRDAYQTIRDYQIAVDRVSELHAVGATPEAIDREVRIDDSAALESLEELETSVTSSIRAKVERRRSDLRLLWLVVIGSALSIATLELVRRRNTRTHTAATDRYTSDMEAFTRIAAHDLKGPLNQIASLVEFIREDVDDKGVVPDLEHHLTRIDERIVRLNARVAGVFNYLRAGTSNEPMKPIDLDVLVSEVAATILDDDIALTVDDRLGTVYGRAAELETVIGNLLSNAVKHHPDHKPNITITAHHGDDGVALHVIDDGPGIADDRRQSVFDMYASLDQLADPLSGVGLAMVKRIVNGWGGDVTVDPVVPHGADFRVSLPTG